MHSNSTLSLVYGVKSPIKAMTAAYTRMTIPCRFSYWTESQCVYFLRDYPVIGRQRTLQDYGLISDTILVAEKRKFCICK